MAHRRVKRKRSKGLTIILLPALIFIGFMGWCMYSMDNQRHYQKKSQNTKDNVTLLPIIFEKQEQIRNF